MRLRGQERLRQQRRRPLVHRRGAHLHRRGRPTSAPTTRASIQAGRPQRGLRRRVPRGTPASCSRRAADRRRSSRRRARGPRRRGSARAHARSRARRRPVGDERTRAGPCGGGGNRCGRRSRLIWRHDREHERPTRGRARPGRARARSPQPRRDSRALTSARDRGDDRVPVRNVGGADRAPHRTRAHNADGSQAAIVPAQSSNVKLLGLLCVVALGLLGCSNPLSAPYGAIVSVECEQAKGAGWATDVEDTDGLALLRDHELHRGRSVHIRRVG